jgi:radical SAM superfamily enzyme YgiQ (UPF0313 family)
MRLSERQPPPFELGPIRPVAEARSLLIRTTRGCPWNRCDFCVNYQDMTFSIRSVEEIKADIAKAAHYYAGHRFASCFLQDGDSFLMKTADLLEVLACIREHFPALERITSYGRAATMVRKTPAQMRQLCDAGLNRLYCGLESGSDAVLERIHKGAAAADLVRAGRMAKEAGMEISEFLIMGLGGRELSDEHARQTAAVCNAIDADFVRVRTIGVKVGSRLEQTLARGEYVLQTEEELICEQRLFLSCLEGITSYYSNDHAVNLLMEVEGRLPAAKPRLLAMLDRFLDLPEAERTHFKLGRRLGLYNSMDDMLLSGQRQQVERRVAAVQEQYPGREDELCHYLRERVV